MKTTAVIVDDDETILDVMTEFLELNDLDVVGKGVNGLEAVALFKEHRPDVLFLDLSMPKYDGKYALRQIRKLDLHANIILVTGEISAQTDSEIDSLNPSAIILKPFDIKELLNTTKTILAM